MTSIQSEGQNGQRRQPTVVLSASAKLHDNQTALFRATQNKDHLDHYFQIGTSVALAPHLLVNKSRMADDTGEPCFAKKKRVEKHIMKPPSGSTCTPLPEYKLGMEFQSNTGASAGTAGLKFGEELPLNQRLKFDPRKQVVVPTEHVPASATARRPKKARSLSGCLPPTLPKGWRQIDLVACKVWNRPTCFPWSEQKLTADTGDKSALNPNVVAEPLVVDSADEVDRFRRKVASVKNWLHRSKPDLSSTDVGQDLTSMLRLQHHHQQVQQDLIVIGQQVKTIGKTASHLQQTCPEKDQFITDLVCEINCKWAEVEQAYEARTARLNASFDVHLLNSDLRYLISRNKEMTAVIMSEDQANDVADNKFRREQVDAEIYRPIELRSQQLQLVDGMDVEQLHVNLDELASTRQRLEEALATSPVAFMPQPATSRPKTRAFPRMNPAYIASQQRDGTRPSSKEITTDQQMLQQQPISTAAHGRRPVADEGSMIENPSGFHFDVAAEKRRAFRHARSDSDTSHSSFGRSRMQQADFIPRDGSGGFFPIGSSAGSDYRMNRRDLFSSDSQGSLSRLVSAESLSSQDSGRGIGMTMNSVGMGTTSLQHDSLSSRDSPHHVLTDHFGSDPRRYQLQMSDKAPHAHSAHSTPTARLRVRRNSEPDYANLPPAHPSSAGQSHDASGQPIYMNQGRQYQQQQQHVVMSLMSDSQHSADSLSAVEFCKQPVPDTPSSVRSTSTRELSASNTSEGLPDHGFENYDNSSIFSSPSPKSRQRHPHPQQHQSSQLPILVQHPLLSRRHAPSDNAPLTLLTPSSLTQFNELPLQEPMSPTSERNNRPLSFLLSFPTDGDLTTGRQAVDIDTRQDRLDVVEGSSGDASAPLNNRRPMIESHLGHHSDTDMEGHGVAAERSGQWWMGPVMPTAAPDVGPVDQSVNTEDLTDLLNKRQQLESDLQQRSTQLQELREQHAHLKQLLEQQEQETLQAMHEQERVTFVSRNAVRTNASPAAQSNNDGSLEITTHPAAAAAAGGGSSVVRRATGSELTAVAAADECSDNDDDDDDDDDDECDGTVDNKLSVELQQNMKRLMEEVRQQLAAMKQMLHEQHETSDRDNPGDNPGDIDGASGGAAQNSLMDPVAVAVLSRGHQLADVEQKRDSQCRAERQSHEECGPGDQGSRHPSASLQRDLWLKCEPRVLPMALSGGRQQQQQLDASSPAAQRPARKLPLPVGSPRYHVRNYCEDSDPSRLSAIMQVDGPGPTGDDSFEGEDDVDPDDSEPASKKPKPSATSRFVVEESVGDEAWDNSVIFLSQKRIVELELVACDYVIVKGNRELICVVLAGETVADDKIRMNRCLRFNLRAKIGDTVSVHVCRDIQHGKRVDIKPIDDTVEGLVGACRPLQKDDIITIRGHRGGMHGLAFKVTRTDPEPFCIVAPDTLIHCESEPVKRETEENSLSEVGYSDVGGCCPQLAEIKKLMISAQPRCVLLYGPPGSGKKLVARAVANETGTCFLLLNGADMACRSVDECVEVLRETFANAEQKVPAVIYVDELVAFAPKSEVEKCRRILTELESLMRNVKQHKSNVTVMLATETPADVDSALFDLGVLDQEVRFLLPNVSDRLHLLQLHTRNVKLAGDVDLDQLAIDTDGYTACDLAAVCWEAAQYKVRDEINGDNIDVKALDTITVSQEDIFTQKRIHDVFKKHGIRWQYFNKECLTDVSFDISDADLNGRLDLTGECVLTVDSAGARDRDDSLHVRVLSNGNFEVGVSIVDVTHYVKSNSALDREAQQRCSSLYVLNRRRVTMFPDVLARFLSLDEGQLRLTFTVLFEITSTGHFIGLPKFRKSFIKSLCSLTHNAAQAIIDDDRRHDWVATTLRTLLKLARLSRETRKSKGAFKLALSPSAIRYFENPETKEYLYVEPKEIGEMDLMVNEWMVLANEAVAQQLVRALPEAALCRNNPPPSAADFGPLTRAAAACRTKIPGWKVDVSSGQRLVKSLDRAICTTDSYINTVLRVIAEKCTFRCGSKYVCAGEFVKKPRERFPVGLQHYGEGMECYTHFTSPLRRYVDVVTHRQLAECLGFDRCEAVTCSTTIKEICQKLKMTASLVKKVERFASFVIPQVTFNISTQFQCPGYILSINKGTMDLLFGEIGLQKSINYSAKFASDKGLCDLINCRIKVELSPNGKQSIKVEPTDAPIPALDDPNGRIRVILIETPPRAAGAGLDALFEAIADAPNNPAAGGEEGDS